MSLNDFSLTNAVASDALFIFPDAHSVLSPRQKTEPKNVRVRNLEITRLPGAMRNMGWVTSARMMERWFNTPAFTIPADPKQRPELQRLPWQQLDESIISMNWASHFERCRTAIDQARENSFHTAAGLARLGKLLKADGWDGKRPHSFGYYGMPAKQMDQQCQINATGLGAVTDTLDDMYGALGRANLKVGVVGAAMNQDGRQRFRVDHLGFYIFDKYDFNGHQYLGTWTDKRVLTKAEIMAAGTYVGRRVYKARDNSPIAIITNGDFRDYRTRTGRGGDFYVLSDVLWERVNVVIDLDSLT